MGARRAPKRSPNWWQDKHFNWKHAIMADEGNVLTDLEGNPIKPNGADNLPSAGIITPYVKDLSIENPNAPAVFQWTEQPQIDLQFNSGAGKVSDQVSEVELKITLTAKTSQGDA